MSQLTNLDTEMAPASPSAASVPPYPGHEEYGVSEQRGQQRPLGPAATPRYARNFDRIDKVVPVPPQAHRGMVSGSGEVVPGGFIVSTNISLIGTTQRRVEWS